METFGAENTSTKSWFANLLEKAIGSGKIILDISQCQVGSVELGRYQTSKELMDMGVVSGTQITAEKEVCLFIYGRLATRVN